MTMASLSLVNDITKPINTNNWFPFDKDKRTPTKEQMEVLKTIEKKENNTNRSNPVDTAMEIDNVIQESMPWIQVTNKKDSYVENKDNMDTTMDSTMKKVRVTMTIRAPKDTSNFSPAKLHIDTLHEMHKFDDTLLVFNTSGDTKVNIKAPITETRYKDLFKPVEKYHGRIALSTVSIAHDIYMTGKTNECKEAIFPFLKKNKIFMYFNPKPGLEHFTAIGVLFGPNPDFTWRDELSDLLIDTMKNEITQEEIQEIGKTEDGQPKLLLSLNIQTLGISKPTETIVTKHPNARNKQTYGNNFSSSGGSSSNRKGTNIHKNNRTSI
jgi:hypothetical protein